MIADAHGALGSALAGLFGPSSEISASSQRRWSSVTFTGARHRYSLRITGTAALEAMKTRLAEQDFALPGHVVADIAMTGCERIDPACAEIELEALTVEAN